MHGARYFLAVLSTVALVLALIPSVTTACDPAAGMGVIFDDTLSMTSAAQLDGKIYVFGGVNGTGMVDTVRVVDPVLGTFDTLDVTLSGPTSNPVAFTYEDRIFIVGGQEPGGNQSANITIFTPPNIIETKPDLLPYGIQGNSVAFDGTFFYFFGNCLCASSAGTRQNVIRFDSAALTCEVYENIIPFELAGSAAVWYEGAAYIFGGQTTGNVKLGTILKYIPGEPMEELDPTIPYPVMMSSAVLYKEHVFILGGLSEQGIIDKVQVFSFEEMDFLDLERYLTHPKASRATVVIGDTAHIIGGVTPDGQAQGVEDYTLCVPEDHADNDTGWGTGDIVLTLGIIGAVVIFLIVIGVYIQTYWKKGKDDMKEDEQKTDKKK